jgi:hypothetical protein
MSWCGEHEVDPAAAEDGILMISSPAPIMIRVRGNSGAILLSHSECNSSGVLLFERKCGIKWTDDFFLLYSSF